MTSERLKKRRKKKSSSDNTFMIAIGIAIAFVVVVGIAVVLRQTVLRPAADRAQTTAEDPNLLASSQTVNPIAIAPVESPAASLNNASQPSTDVEKNGSKMVTRDDDEAKPTPERLNASDEFFNQGKIPELRIEIEEAELQKLKEGPRTFVIGSPRPYVHGTITDDDGVAYTDVAIKLKGSAGSFRPVDDRPALSINVSKYQKEQTFHGLSKFHLNNSVQDDTYLHEWISQDLFRAAKLPATRVTHARVWLNGRDLGFYVLKSAFDKAFLKRHFADAKGNLYEGGFVQDIDAELEKDSGKGPDDRSDLSALFAACREPIPETRWEKVDQLLNVDQFVSFMAMEMMIGHWDGYTLNHNNYRIYFDPGTNQANFLPHGMDQVFGNAGASIVDFPSSIVGSTVMLNAEWRQLYRKRVGELLSLFSPTDQWLKRVDVVNDRLRPVLTKISSQATRDHDDRVARLKERLVARVENLIRQQSQPDPQPREFDENGRLKLTDWYTVSESPDTKLELVDAPKGPKVSGSVDSAPPQKAYSILSNEKGKGNCNASWRCKTLLAKGTYVLNARMKTDRVNAPDQKNVAVGAGLRTSGQTRSNVRKGTVNWTPVEFEFTVNEDVRNVEFIAELRARKGQVWFEVDSLYLTRKQ